MPPSLQAYSCYAGRDLQVSQQYVSAFQDTPPEALARLYSKGADGLTVLCDHVAAARGSFDALEAYEEEITGDGPGNCRERPI